MALADPIAELLESLARHGAPDPEWIARWSAAAHGDPLANAWAQSHDVIAMAQLLDLLQQGVLVAANPREFLRAAASLPDDPWAFPDSDALRRAVPAPPTLPQALRARASLPPGALDASQARWRASAAPPSSRYAAG